MLYLLKKFLKYFLVILSFLSVNSGIFLTSVSAYNSDHKVIIIAANGVGDTYFHAKRQFESEGWSVSTAGLTSSVTSCPNTNPRPIPVDFLISELTNSTITQYEAIFIPSGGHWFPLINDVRTLNLISDAYDLRLVISSLCVGIRVLARANIINEVRIAYDINSVDYVEAAGGILVNKEVVSDQRIVTGGI